jgi:hypothetical protein
VAVLDCLCNSNVEDDERICAIILFEDVSDDCSIDDASDPMKIMRNRVKATRNVQNTARRMIINALKWTLLKIVFIGKDNMMCDKVKSSTHIRRRWQNFLTILPGVISQARTASTTSEARNYLITDAIRDYVVQQTS